MEDNLGDADLIQEVLAEIDAAQYQLTHVERLGQALQRLGTEKFEVILLDLSLPDGHRLDTLKRMQDAAPELPIVVLTGFDNDTFAARAIRQGAQDYLIKGQISGPLLGRILRYAIERKQVDLERERLISQLEEALGQIKTLSGFLPICSNCKKIRDDEGYWRQVELYIQDHSQAVFSHSICPECFATLYSGFSYPKGENQ